MSSDHDTDRLKNFHLWKFKMQAMLKAKSLWSAIQRMLPLDTSDQDACRKEEKTMAALVLSLGDEELLHVQNPATAAEVLRSCDGGWRWDEVMAQQREAFGAKSTADDMTLEFLTARLLHEETRRSEGQDGSGKDRREGHIKKECGKRLAAEQQSSEANQAFGHEAFAFSAISTSGGHWIID
ncbi:hypothetical protein PhCBS80983_g06507 [Powellomyces hirtus]|uniref:DUF4219 domain-containing protein n=1 Tax=Powellomyces hirtus TaxID=109895 RepID=A0A507DKE1_9FUNG|nr:hypothetical protein PhCBS80983_g06507 [Powellomyces hirtus]